MPRLFDAAAAMLNDYGAWQLVTGNSLTGQSLLKNIRSIFDSAVNNATMREAANEMYLGYSHSFSFESPDASLEDLINTVLVGLQVELLGISLGQSTIAENRISAFVIGAIAGTRAAIELIDGETMQLQQVRSSSSTIGRIIESIDWDMSKADVENAYSYMERLPDHPTQNAISFETAIVGRACRLVS